jgi:hypothetical protein
MVSPPAGPRMVHYGNPLITGDTIWVIQNGATPRKGRDEAVPRDASATTGPKSGYEGAEECGWRLAHVLSTVEDFRTVLCPEVRHATGRETPSWRGETRNEGRNRG